MTTFRSHGEKSQYVTNGTGELDCVFPVCVSLGNVQFGSVDHKLLICASFLFVLSI